MSEVISTLLKLEEELRNLATDIQTERYDRIDMNRLEKIIDLISDARDYIYYNVCKELSLIYPERGREVTKFINSVLELLNSFTEKLDEIISEGLLPEEVGYSSFKYSLTRGSIYELVKEQEEYLNTLYNDVNTYCRKLLKTKCTFLDSPMEGKIPLASLSNDISSTVHRIAEFLQRFYYKKIPNTICYAGKDADPLLIEACKKWSEFVEINHSEGLYSFEDYDALEGFVTKDRLILRVGSSEGHATHINVSEGTLDYYDTDYDVNETIHDLLERVGLDCEIHSKGVSCTGVKRDKDLLTKIVAILSFATSMDFRLEEPERYWGEFMKDKIREVLSEELKEVIKEIKKA